MTKFEEAKKKVFDYLKYLILYGYPGKILGALVAVLILMPIPFNFYIFFRWLLEPEGFWQNFALFVVWAICLGWLQLIFCVACIAFAIGILTDNL
jgi:hypothetical protein